jgi:hypothetical protein
MVKERRSMHTIVRLEQVLIELAYEAADCSDRKALTSDPLELARMEALLQKLRCARIAVQFALDSVRAASDLGIPQAA